MALVSCSFRDINMKIWFICFVVLFALAQLFDWIQQFSLPLPIYILGGAFLAVASNYEKLFGSSLINLGETFTQQQQLDATSQPEVSTYFNASQSVGEIEQSEVIE